MATHPGVRFVYEERLEPEPAWGRGVDENILTPERLNALPEEWVATLSAAAENDGSARLEQDNRPNSGARETAGRRPGRGGWMNRLREPRRVNVDCSMIG